MTGGYGSKAVGGVWGGLWVGWSGSLEEELLTWRWPTTSQTAGLAGGDSG